MFGDPDVFWVTVGRRPAGSSSCNSVLFKCQAMEQSTVLINLCKYTAVRALYIWLSVIRTRKCDTSDTKTSYCIRCKGTGCVLSGGLELQLWSSLTSAPYAGGWRTAHLGHRTAIERAFSTYGAGGCLDIKTVLDTLEDRRSLVLARNENKFPLLAGP